MHACGHDIHAAWTVGVAALLAVDPPDGDVVIVLQPSEETGTGALAILESGVLDDVHSILGGHVDMRFPVGQIVADAGPIAAATDIFEIDITGKGGHSARPHETTDVVVAAAAMVSAAQTIISRRLKPGLPGVVTIGAMNAGAAANVIPERAILRGTIRAVDPRSRTLMRDALRRIVEGTAAAHGVRGQLNIVSGTPPLINTAATAGVMQAVGRDLLGAGAVIPLPEPNLAGEDFAFYLERMQGCFVRLGAAGAGDAPIPAHSPRFLPLAESILVGAAVLADGARRLGVAR
jgi:hippurate hydrolase